MNEREYLLVCLIEEQAETIHALCKALRFGLTDKKASEFDSNIVQIQKEYADSQGVVELLEERHGVIVENFEELDDHIDQKKEKVIHYLGYSADMGCLTQEEKEKLVSNE